MTGPDPSRVAHRHASASRVARRHVAGLLKAPPAMVKEITEWVQDSFAMWIVEKASINRDLIHQVYKEEYALRSIDRGGARRLRSVRDAFLEWGEKPYSWGRFDDVLAEAEAMKRHGFGLWKHLESIELDKDTFKAMSRQEAKALYDQTAKRFLPILDREIEEADREYLEALRRIKSLKDGFTKADYGFYSNRYHISTVLKVSPEVLSSAKRRSKPKQAYEVSVGYLAYFKPNLDGWAYADLIPKGMLLDSIQVFVDVDEPMPDEVGGSYTGGTLKVFPNVPKLLQSKSGYKRLMREIETAVRHELQHYAQGLLRAAGIKDFGNPSRNIRDLRFSPKGFAAVKGLDDHQRTMKDLYEHGQKSYPLIDAEFYPWLEDSAEGFVEWATEQGLEGSAWDRARRDWVESRGSDIVRAQGAGNARFWNALKKHEPAKWRKAVGEFWKATEQPLTR